MAENRRGEVFDHIRILLLCALAAFFAFFLGCGNAYADNLTDPDLAASMIVPVSEYVPDDGYDPESMPFDSDCFESDYFEPSNSIDEEVTDNRALSSAYYSTATFSRTRARVGCVQNFAVFKRNGETYMLSSYGGSSNHAKVFIQSRSQNGSNSCLEFGEISTMVSGTSATYLQYNGHGDSIEVIEYGGDVYALYVRDPLSGEDLNSSVLAARKITFNSDGSATWDSSERRMQLFKTYNGASQVGCKLATSNNYICIATSYGTSIYNDRERYHVYKKSDFLSAFLSGSGVSWQSDSAIQGCRIATGMFTGAYSIGLTISFEKTVIESLELDERYDSSTGALQNIIVIASCTNRAYNGDPGWTDHVLTRVRLNPCEAGSSAAKNAQIMQNHYCYYSPITHLKYPLTNNQSTTLAMNALVTGTNVNGATVASRTEPEGLKKLPNLGNGISGGWYMTSYNPAFGLVVPTGPYPANGGTPYNYSAGNTPWNYFVYKVQTTPTIIWSPSKTTDIHDEVGEMSGGGASLAPAPVLW